MRKMILISLMFAAMAVVQVTSASPNAYAFNPRAFIMKEKMQKSEEKLQKAENSQGKDRLQYLEDHLKIARKNIESMGQQLTHLNSETNRMTTLPQLIAHEKKMEKYHLTVVKMLHQMVRSQAILLKVVKESTH